MTRSPLFSFHQMIIQESTVFYSWMSTVFWRGGDSHRVPLSLHLTNRKRFCDSFVFPSSQHMVLVFGGEEQPMYNADTTWEGFRQESYFQWLTGAKEPGLVLALTARKEAILFIPKFPEAYETWMGRRRTPEEFKQQYGMDRVFFLDELGLFIQDQRICLVERENSDSGLVLRRDPRCSEWKIDVECSARVGEVLDELRAVKTSEEIAILQFANDVSCKAHIEVMQELYRNAWNFPREYFAEAVFKFGCAVRGCARVGYTCIACSGERNAILHYGHPAEPNNADVPISNHLRLLDMGAEYHCYTADITNTFPSSGTFSELQRSVYTCVLETVYFAERLIKPGVNYRDVHIAAQKFLLEQILTHTELIKPAFRSKLDYLADTLHIVPQLLMPHGLGHMLGLNVHDVGGFVPGDRKAADVSVRGLRLARPLKEGFVLTVEPGIYFIDFLRAECLKDPAIASVVDWRVWETLKSQVGGVRIEDDVVVTATGCRVLTDIPRAPEDVQAVMRGERVWTVGEGYREYVNL